MSPETVVAFSSALASDGKVTRSLPFTEDSFNSEPGNWSTLASELKLSSVNGKLRVTLPSDARAELKATTVSGDISDDFGLPVTRHQFVGRSLHGQLGGGGTLVKLSNVNGEIEIRHASDNRPLSPVQNLERERSRSGEDEKNDDEDDEI